MAYINGRNVSFSSRVVIADPEEVYSSLLVEEFGTDESEEEIAEEEQE